MKEDGWALVLAGWDAHMAAALLTFGVELDGVGVIARLEELVPLILKSLSLLSF